MSTPAPRPAPQEAVLRQAANLGRRHGKAAVYWQIKWNICWRIFRVPVRCMTGLKPAYSMAANKSF